MGSDLPVEVEGLLSFLELAPVQQVGADHHAGAALSRLAVDGSDVLLVLAQPLVQVLAERLYQLQLGRVVVLERVLSDWERRSRATARYPTPDKHTASQRSEVTRGQAHLGS